MAREKSAQLIRERIATFDAKLPVLLVGDFNAGAGRNKAYAMLTDDKFLTDTWTTARERVNEGLGTINGFKALQKDGPAGHDPIAQVAQPLRHPLQSGALLFEHLDRLRCLFADRLAPFSHPQLSTTSRLPWGQDNPEPDAVNPARRVAVVAVR